MKNYKYKLMDVVIIKIDQQCYSATIQGRTHNRNSGECEYRLGDFKEIVRKESEILGPAKSETPHYKTHTNKNESRKLAI